MNENTVESQVMRFEEPTSELLVPEDIKDELIYFGKDELIYFGTEEPLRVRFDIDMSPYQVGDFFTMINIGA